MTLSKVEILDENENIEPIANNIIEFKIKYFTKIIGVENGNMSDTDLVKANKRKVYNGL